ncbi:MotA/TolQ/ExbB proton channel family protein [Niveispirillum sp. KHB5.9]|uniref:MotA/TolQ/ExbB proton channel family protein n=1 Tax=Niveispirillum sp. KHB5.9 TaxID=3400269 RepID=UPI003A889EA0
MNKLFTLAGISRLAAAAAVAATLSAPVFAQSTTPAEPAPAATTPAPEATTAPAPEAATAAEAPAADAHAEAPVNPYGLQAIVSHGDFVAKSTLVLMIIMSAGTWYILIVKLIEQSRLMAQATAAEKNFWTAGSVAEGATRLKETSAFRGIVEDGLRAAEHHDGALTDHIDLHEWVTMSLQRSVDGVNARLQGGLAFLASVGSTAPFIGLFGTVWGILNALVNIGLSGQASIDKVAGPVGEALIMTAIGLIVAVPAVLAYNWLTRRNKLVMDRLRNFSSDLHALLIAGQKAKTARSA